MASMSAAVVTVPLHETTNNSSHVRRVPHRRPERGDGGAPGANIPQPSAQKEALDGGEVDNREGDGRSPPSKEPVYKYGGPGDGGVAIQAPRGPDINRGNIRLIPHPPPGADTSGHHR